MARRIDRTIDLLLRLIDQAYDKKAWHGVTLRGALRTLGLEESLWRPSPRRHNIWEIVLHTAYWKYIIWRKLTGSSATTFPRPGSDWPRLPDSPDKKIWVKDVALLREQHLKLRQAIGSFPLAKLDRCPPNSSWRYIDHIYGIASHDLYHAGQIQLLKRLFRGGALK